MTALLDPSADTIFYNGRVHTLEPALPHATAVAVRDGRFIGVGDEADLHSLVGRRTERIDLGGRAVIPGLIDTHNHLSSTGLGMLQVSLEGSRNIADVLSRIVERAAATPRGEWVVTAPVAAGCRQQGRSRLDFPAAAGRATSRGSPPPSRLPAPRAG